MRLLLKAELPPDHCYLDNKYTVWYYSIIQNAKQRVLNDTDTYTENHHIIPDCFFVLNRSKGKRLGWLLGNSEAPENKVRLTFREHFVCHWLLTKMVNKRNVRQMENALQSFRRSSKSMDRILSSIEFSRAKTADMLAKKGKPSPRRGVPNLVARGKPSPRKGLANTKLKGRSSPWKWWNDGVSEIKSIEQPPGFTNGRLRGRPNYKNRRPSSQKGTKKRPHVKALCKICSMPITRGLMEKHERVCAKTQDKSIQTYDDVPINAKKGKLFTWVKDSQFTRSENSPGDGWMRCHNMLGAKLWMKDDQRCRASECPGEGWTMVPVKHPTHTWEKDGIIKRSIRCPGQGWSIIHDQ